LYRQPRIESPKGLHKAPPRGLTAEEHRRLLAFVDTDETAIRADLPDLIRFAFGFGLRAPRCGSGRCRSLFVMQLRARRHEDDDPTWPVFASAGRGGQRTYRWPSNVRRSV
jgi:hypothetical protein